MGERTTPADDAPNPPPRPDTEPVVGGQSWASSDTLLPSPAAAPRALPRPLPQAAAPTPTPENLAETMQRASAPPPSPSGTVPVFSGGSAPAPPDSAGGQATDPGAGSTPAGQGDSGARTAQPRKGPRQVANYEILSELGRGGMGVVYKARQRGLNRLVALKMVLAGAHAGAEQLVRFHAEAEAVAGLQHPNIVQVYEVGEHDGQPFFSMEFVEGSPLDRRLAGTPQPTLAAAELLETLARAVHYAHEHGVVHRDLKPANILIGNREQRRGGFFSVPCSLFPVP